MAVGKKLGATTRVSLLDHGMKKEREKGMIGQRYSQDSGAAGAS